MRQRGVWWLVLFFLLLVAGCGGAEVQASKPAARNTSGRSVCGWESLDDLSGKERRQPRLAELEGPDRLTLHAGAIETRAAPGSRVVVLEADPDVTFATVRDALSPAAETLLRVKVVLDKRWLLPMTSRGRVPVKPPPRSETVPSVVGHRLLLRPRGARADRFADLRLEGNELSLYVENENPAGKRLAVGELRAALRRVDPPATVFAITATDDTPWRAVITAFVSAACFDRAPDEEPHEVILD